MGMSWYRQDRGAVVAALRRGERPDMATTMSSGPLDELVALHDALGVFAALDAVAVERQRAGIADGLLLRTLATLPFVAAASLSGATELLFKEPAILLHLGWAAVQIREGSNGRHCHRAGALDHPPLHRHPPGAQAPAHRALRSPRRLGPVVAIEGRSARRKGGRREAGAYCHRPLPSARSDR